LNCFDRLFWTTLRRIWSRWTDVLVLVKPETVVGWHRAGFRLHWRWWPGLGGGRPETTAAILALICRLAQETTTIAGQVRAAREPPDAAALWGDGAAGPRGTPALPAPIG